MSASHAAHSAPRGSRWWTGLGVAVVVVLAALGAGTYFALHSRLFAATSIRVLGARHESAAQVVAAAGLDAAPPMISLDGTAIAHQVEASFAWIATVSVVEHWTHGVTITVHERVPVATVRTHAGALELVDVTGRRLGGPGHGQTLPGLQFAVKKGSVHGVDLSSQLPPASAPGLIVASTLPPAFSSQVAMITVDARGWVTLHMTTPVTFKLGPASNLGAKYEAVAAIIDHTTLHVGDVVDVSVPQASTVTGP